MATKIFRNPTFKTTIIEGVFINQDLTVYPHGRVPDNLSTVVKFLFGEDARVTLDGFNNHGCIKITNANYVLENVKTLNADWTCEEVKE